MSIDSLKQAFKPLNDFKLAEILEKDPTRVIEVINRKNGKTYRLCLNSHRQLCYRDGNNVRLLPTNSADFELVEDEQALLPDFDPTVRLSVDSPLTSVEHSDSCRAPVSLPPTSMDILNIVTSFNRMVDGLAARREPDAPPPPKKVPEVLEKLQTNYRVLVPSDYEINDLAAKYVVAITQSIIDLKLKVLPKANVQVGKLLTTGLVKNLPGLLPLIEEALQASGYEFEEAPPNGSYLRLTVWLEN